VPSRKTLKSVAHNTAESFASLMNYSGSDYVMGHAVAAAWETGVTLFRVDLLTGVTNPAARRAPHVADGLARYAAHFPNQVRNEGSDPSLVRVAELVVTVDPSVKRPVHVGFTESPFTCTARITDDRGTIYEHTVAGWWYPEGAPHRTAPTMTARRPRSLRQVIRGWVRGA
jgi:hypothetical protein